MNRNSPIQSALRWVAAGMGAAAGAYAAYVGVAWSRNGRAAHAVKEEDADPLLDRLMPISEVGGRHHIRTAAPPATTLAVARDMDLLQSPVVRAIIRARELVVGATPDRRPRP